MGLSNDLIAQFVKTTRDEPKRVTEKIVYGKAVVSDGKTYVKLTDSELLTPAITTTDVKDGEQVTVLIKDHSAIVTGNTSDPAASSTGVKALGDKVTAQEGDFQKLSADTAEFKETTTERLEVSEAYIDNAMIRDLQVEHRFVALEAAVENLDVESLDARYASIERIEAVEGLIDDLVVGDLTAKYATVERMEVVEAAIDDLVVGNFDAKYASIERMEAVEATIQTADIENLRSKYATVDFANIGELAMKNFYANSGLIKDVVVSNGTVTGTLTGVTITGDLIKANTILADKLVVKGEDGLYYRLNTDGETVEALQTDYNSLDGSVITAKSITATKISVSDLVAFGATIGGFHISNSALYSGVKSTIVNTTSGVFLDSNGQVHFGDAVNYIKYYNNGGTWKLNISSDNFKLDGTEMTVRLDNAAKTASNYLSFDNGLIVGDLTASKLGNNVFIDSDSIDIRNGTTTLASFGADHLYLAKNSRNATIDLCNGLATMYHESKYSYDTLFVIQTGNSTEIMGLINPLCITSVDDLDKVSIQFANSNGVMGGVGIIGTWLRRFGSNMFDSYTILDSGNFSDVMDTGWIHCSYGDGFTRYSNNQANLQVRRVGKQVYLRGEAKPTKAVTPDDDTSTVLGVIPEGYRPSYRQQFVMQGSAAYKWTMSIYPSGNIVISRYTNSTTMNMSISAGAWLCCHAQWMID